MLLVEDHHDVDMAFVRSCGIWKWDFDFAMKSVAVLA